MSATPQASRRGIVKQVLSGDSVVIREQPKGGPPPERTVSLSNIIAPKLGRRATATLEETKDEPYAWEAREFLRKKLIGQEVVYTVERPNTTRDYGTIFFGKNGTPENVTDTLVSEGLVTVRRESIRAGSEHAHLIELEDAAKTAGKGKWAASGSQEHVREIKWNIENPRNFVDSFQGKPVKAVIEHVRDGSTVRAFLLPDFYHITLMISGIRCPGFKLNSEGKPDKGEPFADEAKFFVETRLLQQDVEIVLESVNNVNFVGSIIHPKGNIAEALLKEGFAKCVDWSMAFVTGGSEKLRSAEKFAKEKKVRIWKDWVPSGPQITGKEKEFTGTVTEVVNADALMIKAGDSVVKKVFLASIRPPRLPDDKSGETAQRPKGFRPLYDIPWMYEAREFLRKKLIGKKVNVVVDYIQPPANNFPEKTCCTVTIGGVNVAEAMVSKGYATVIRYRQDDDQRSSHYDELLAAEMKAAKSGNGLHAKKGTVPTHRVADISGDLAKAKQFLPFLQRVGRTEATVEFVASGSRLRLYVPKETCLITFLLAGISCPRGARPAVSGSGMMEGEPYGEDALKFTKERCLQREVEIAVESMDKAGNYIGWLWVNGQNLSVMLVEEGLASVHFTAERSAHFSVLTRAEETAKSKKIKIWTNYEEQKEEEKKDEEEKVTERTVDYQKVLVIEATPELHFYAQFVEQGPKLEQLMEKMRQEFTANPPLTGAYTPKKGDLCASKYIDGGWYRARVEKVSAGKVSVLYVDYGNREVVESSKCAVLPSSFATDKPFAHEYGLACVQLHNDADYKEDAIKGFMADIADRTLLMNIEYRVGSVPYATLTDPESKEDVAQNLIKDGLLRVEHRRERRLQKLVQEYRAAQDTAKKNHVGIWEYGDVTEDDAKEFGLGLGR